MLDVLDPPTVWPWSWPARAVNRPDRRGGCPAGPDQWVGSVWTGHGEGRLHRCLRGVAGVDLDLSGLHHGVACVVVKTEVDAVEREADLPRLSRVQIDPLESPKPAHGLRD